jgi:CBS-domain-containing membrane protein
MNGIIRGDIGVNRLQYVEVAGKMYPISVSDERQIVYHTSDMDTVKKIHDTQQSGQKLQTVIDIDKQLLKKILYPVGKKKYEMSFSSDIEKSFKIKVIDENMESIQLLIY